MRIASAAAAAISFALATHASAQWQKLPDKNVPIEAGKPNLAARAPRVDRKTPDLSGVWLPDPDPNGKPGGLERIVFPRYFVDNHGRLRARRDHAAAASGRDSQAEARERGERPAGGLLQAGRRAGDQFGAACPSRSCRRRNWC